jgi:dihydropteroate synthase
VSLLRHNQLFSAGHPLIMGVVNVTPDSFSDGGLYASANKAVQHAKRLIDEGVDILDIGGESTRPGSEPVSVAEELNRVIPVIQALSDMNVAVSVDTSKPEVMRQAIEAGATMVNDVNALRAPGAIEVVKEAEHVLICLMHMQSEPRSMQRNPQYTDVVKEVMDFLRQRLTLLETEDISKKRLVIDPGFGFGKTLEHNLILLRSLDKFLSLGVPVLVGLSRKSMLGAITGNAVDYRIHESVAAALLAVIKGARIIRVHDVKATKDAFAVCAAVNDVV